MYVASLLTFVIITFRESLSGAIGGGSAIPSAYHQVKATAPNISKYSPITMCNIAERTFDEHHENNDRIENLKI